METQHESAPVEVFSGSVWEAEVVQGLLENAGIVSLMHDEYAGTIAPWRATAGGVDAVSLLVSPEDSEEARRLIQEYHAGDNTTDEI